MKIKSSRRVVRRLGLALAVAAVFAPSAQAMPMSVAGEQGTIVQSRQYADDIRVAPPVRKYADDRVVSQVGGHEGYMPINELAQVAPTSTPAESSSSTDWSFTVGIGTLFIVFGLGAALLVAVRHSRRDRLAAT